MKKERLYLYYLPLIIMSAFLFTTGCVPSLETSQRASPQFRKVQWRNTKDWVRMQERDERIHADIRNALVYNIRYNGIPMRLIYGFRIDKGVHRLRTAGYLTPSGASVDNPEKVFRQDLFEKFGEPTQTLGSGGMLWIGSQTVIYTNIYYLAGGRPVSLEGTKFDSIPLIPRDGHTARTYYLIVGYMERGFYDEILETLNKESLEDAEFSTYKRRSGYKLSDDNRLSEYEEKLFSGMLREIFRQNLREKTQ
ncbi:MAG: hypothetical protein OYL97_03280 [Candidatus Poribacteria bacterium]|nr:hypothetical protein [Candidatus Poribacteria bacterium]